MYVESKRVRLHKTQNRGKNREIAGKVNYKINIRKMSFLVSQNRFYKLEITFTPFVTNETKIYN